MTDPPVPMPPLRGIVVAEPFKALPAGTEIPITIVQPHQSNAGAEPADVSNWSFFQGALLAAQVQIGDIRMISGSAAMVAPGLAVSATHVFEDVVNAIAADSENVSVACVGTRDSWLDVWHVRKV